MLLPVTALLIARCHISSIISIGDESTYIAVAHRLMLGDALLVDDWYGPQTNGVLLLPFFWAYTMITGSTDGVVVFFRMVYIALKLVVSIWAINRLARANKLGAVSIFAVGIFYVSSSFNVDAISYNTLPVISWFVVLVMLYTGMRLADPFWAGVWLGLAIVSQPFALLVYLLWPIVAVAVSILCAVTKKRQIAGTTIRDVLIAILGAAVVGGLVIAFVLSRASLGDILENLPYIMSEQDHTSDMGWIGRILQGLSLQLFYDIKVVIVGVVSVAVCAVFRKRKWIVYLPVAAFLLLGIYSALMGKYLGANFFYVPALWFAIDVLIISTDKDSIVLDLWQLLFCVTLVIVVSLATNTGMMATSGAMCILAIDGMLMLEKAKGRPGIVRTDGRKRRTIIGLISSGVFACVLALHLLLSWGFRIHPGMDLLYLDRGPLKGSFAKGDVHNHYKYILDTIDSIQIDEPMRMFVTGNNPVLYLYAADEYGTPFTAFSNLDYSRVDKFYEIHPDKIPNVVFYPNLSDADVDSNFYQSLVSKGYKVSEDGCILIKE